MALTDSPGLEAGVSLAIMAMPQTIGFTVPPIPEGERMPVRFGYCCPRIEEVVIVRARGDTMVVSLGSDTFVLRQAEGGVDVPGIVSEDWIVV